MPRIARELSALEVKRLTKPGLHAVGGCRGLHLQVSKTGARSWVLRIMVGGKRRDIGLGAFADVPLARAREKARETRELVESGIDPIAARRAAKARLKAETARQKTFKECAALLIKVKQAEFKNAKHAKQWPATLESYVYPVIGDLPVDKVELGHITQILEPIWTTKTETATRVRQRVEAVIDYASAKGWRDGPNPARWKGHLDKIMSKPSKLKRVKHHAALPIDGAPDFMQALRLRQGMAARALEFLILTAVRSGEVRGATWSEIDLQAKVWTIPPERMKMETEHRVPLSDEAAAILEKLPRMAGTELVFPSARGGQLSDMTMAAVVKRMHEAELNAGRAGYLDPKQNRVVTPHGFRSTFRDWAAERTNFAREVAEMSLAHAIDDKVEAAYRRGELMEKRRRLMAAWAKFCTRPRPAAEVLPLRA